MTGLAEFVSGTAGALQAARCQGGVGLSAEFDNGAYIQYQVNPELRGTDGRASLAVEIGDSRSGVRRY